MCASMYFPNCRNATVANVEVAPAGRRAGEQSGAAIGECVKARYLVTRNAQHFGDDFDRDLRTVIGDQVALGVVI